MYCTYYGHMFCIVLRTVLAKKYLSIQATSAPSERIFSKAGRIIDEQRTRLNSEIAGNLLYVAMNYSWHKKRKTQDGES